MDKSQQELESTFKQLIGQYKYHQLVDEVILQLSDSELSIQNIRWRLVCYQYLLEAYQKLDYKNKVNEISIEIAEALDVYDEHIPSDIMVLSLVSLAAIKVSQYEFEEGKKIIDKVLSVAEIEGYPDSLGKIYTLQGNMYNHKGDYEEANRQYQKSLEQFTKANNLINVGAAHI